MYKVKVPINSEGLTFQQFFERFIRNGIHKVWTQDKRGKERKTPEQTEFLKKLVEEILEGEDNRDEIRCVKSTAREAKTKGEVSCLIDLWKFEHDYRIQKYSNTSAVWLFFWQFGQFFRCQIFA